VSYYTDPLVTLLHGDCIEVLPTLEAESVDAVVTDPPYGLGFMGKAWDSVGRNDLGGVRAHDQGYGPITSNPTCRSCGGLQSLKSEGSGGRHKCRCASPVWPNWGARDGQKFQAWCEQWGREALRVTKPGGYLLAFGGTRTHHRLVCALEDAGWIIRDELDWIYAAGFPKSHNASKDARFCQCGREAQPEHDVRPVRDADVPPTVATSGGDGSVLFPEVSEPGLSTASVPSGEDQARSGERVVEGRGDLLQEVRELRRRAVRASAGVGGSNGPEGRLHHGASVGDGSLDRPPAHSSGSGESPRPQSGEQSDRQPGAVALERDAQSRGVWPLCDRCGKQVVPVGLGTALKPAHEPIVLARKPLSGTVADNIERHGTGALNIDECRIGVGEVVPGGGNGKGNYQLGDPGHYTHERPIVEPHTGRWPSNLLLSDPELFDEPNPYVVGSGATSESAAGTQKYQRADTSGWKHRGGVFKPGREWEAEGYGDSGGYSRFFIVPKADRTERNRGLTERSSHPTVKPIDLMRHLVRLVTPNGGTVLDPFLGSGTTALAASEEGFRCIGIEREAEYLEIAKGRLMATPMGFGLDHGITGKAPPKTHPDLSKHQPKRRAASENYTGGWTGTTTVKIEDAGYTASKDDPCTCDHERPDGRHVPSPGCRMCEWCVDEEPAA
jgi:DNA modification methylase